MPLLGSCFCSTITYELAGGLRAARACHCSRCRKAFGGAGSAYAEVVDPMQFRWLTGIDKLARHGSTWALVFASCCGTTLVGEYAGEVHGIALGSVDGDPGVAIEWHQFVDSKAPWDHIGGAAPQFGAEHTAP